MRLGLHAFFDPATFTLTYIVWDPVQKSAVIMDPVLDFDPATQMLSKNSLNQVVEFVRAKSLRVEWILETHAHADHLSSARELREIFPGSRWALGRRMVEVFNTFKKVLSWPASLTIEQLGVDRWLGDSEEIALEGFKIKVFETPGHTPACLTFQIGDWLFTGDALMMPDSGVGRCDFPGGSASQLYDSIWGKLYALPDDLRVFPGHDYQPGGRPLRYESSLGEQKTGNIHLASAHSREAFVQFREGRDKTLNAPRLLQPSLDWNLGAHQIVKRSKA